MAKRKNSRAKKKVSSSNQTNQTFAIVALILNILLPGLGSLIAGKSKEGAWQIIIALISFPLMLIFIGFLTYLAAWIWGIITGIKLIQKAS